MEIVTVDRLTRDLGNKPSITLKNVRVTALDSKKIVGRYSMNKDGCSFMKIERLPKATEPDGPKAICFFTHYSCGFGHAFHAMISSYSHYLRVRDSFDKDLPLVTFEGDTHLHHLNRLYSEFDGRELLSIADGESITFQELTFFNRAYKPAPINSLCVETIRRHLSFDGFVPHPKLAILKTTKSRKLDNPINPHGNMREDRIRPLLEEYGFVLLEHAELDFEVIAKYLSKCDFLVTNWGATSAWASLLRNDQRCYCIVGQSYWGEVGLSLSGNSTTYKNLCFNPELFSNFKISARGVGNSLPDRDLALIRGELREFVDVATNN